FGAAAGANVVVVQVEALSHWVVDAEVEGRPVAPFLRQLRGACRFYPRILDQTSDGRTSDAEYSVLNSLHPLPRGAVAYIYPANRFVALPALLQEQGYTTLSAHAFKRGFWNRGRVHPAYGFEHTLFRAELGRGERISWGLADHLFFERSVDELLKLPRPFFGFLITLSTHPPFEDLPPGHEVLPVGDLEGTALGRYLQLVHYLDGAMRVFFDRLESEGLLEETMVIVYGDHTAEGFDPKRLKALAGLPGDAPDAAALAFVPLFLHLPTLHPRQGEMAQELLGPAGEIGGLIDIAPTVLHLLGEERPAIFLGLPLVPGGADRAYRWKWRLAAGEGKFALGNRCRSLEDWSWRRRFECRGLRDQAEAELGLSYRMTVYDLAADLDKDSWNDTR
ncbi:MAG: LTA synthase family protein, partial [Acidobacteria bacterium]|nr:LTA synthase family protein [Acidobacteriota bacterium]